MSIEVSKVVSYATIGDSVGLNVSKIVAYVIMEPGPEAGAPPPPPGQGYTYAQLLRPAAASVPGSLLLSGDMQDDTDDALLLSGDMQDDADDKLIVGT